jgi:response regulator NasT
LQQRQSNTNELPTHIRTLAQPMQTLKHITRRDGSYGMQTALVCDSDDGFREEIKEFLPSLGYSTVLLCTTRGDALALAVEQLPQLVVLEAAPPICGLKLATTLRNHIDTKILLTVCASDLPLLKQADNAKIDAFLARPATRSQLPLAVELALRTAQQVTCLQTLLEQTKNALQERKIIERAKGLLMEKEQLSEELAYRRLRNQAMARRVSMTVLAEEMISSATKKR